MTVKFSTIKAGDTLYDCRMQKQGDTTMSALAIWEIRVISTDAESATISWNGNSPRREYREYFEDRNIRRSPPEFARQSLFLKPSCYFCGETKESGHSDSCKRPGKKARRLHSAKPT